MCLESALRLRTGSPNLACIHTEVVGRQQRRTWLVGGRCAQSMLTNGVLGAYSVCTECLLFTSWFTPPSKLD